VGDSTDKIERNVRYYCNEKKSEMQAFAIHQMKEKESSGKRRDK
jgi:hypothetical protein